MITKVQLLSGHHIKNESAYPGKLHYPSAVLLGGWLQIVYLPQLSTNISVCLFPSQLILIIIPRPLLTPLTLNLQHIRYVDLVRF